MTSAPSAPPWRSSALLIVIDECHRGSAAEDSAWREILEYFSAATLIGLTAMPKETAYVSNIHYFGKPVDASWFCEGVKTGLKGHLLTECNLHTFVRLPNSMFRPYAGIGTNLPFFGKGEATKEVWFYEHCVPVGQKAYSMIKPVRTEDLQGCVGWWGGGACEGRQNTEVTWIVSRLIVSFGAPSS